MCANFDDMKHCITTIFPLGMGLNLLTSAPCAEILVDTSDFSLFSIHTRVTRQVLECGAPLKSFAMTFVLPNR